MFTKCPHCSHRFDARKNAEKEPFLRIEKGSAPWKLLKAYNEQSGPKLDEDIYQIAQEMFPNLDVASPWRIITSLIKSGYVTQVGKEFSGRGRLARTCAITTFGRVALDDLEWM